MNPAIDNTVPDTDFVFRDEVAENGAAYVIWAAVAAHRIKGQAPFVSSACLDEAGARLEYRVWRKAFAEDGNSRAASDALWSLKFGGSAS